MFRRVLSLVALTLFAGPLLAGNDYPTMDRVDHVLTCMKRNGGQNVDNLYRCSCEIDAIAQKITVEEFNTARTYEIYKNMPGEKGGLFREGEEAQASRDKIAAARKEAEKRCFVGAKRQTVVPTAQGMPKAEAAAETPKK